MKITNPPKFYITTKRTSWLDKEFVVFGKVIDGWVSFLTFTPTRKLRKIVAITLVIPCSQG